MGAQAAITGRVAWSLSGATLLSSRFKSTWCIKTKQQFNTSHHRRPNVAPANVGATVRTNSCHGESILFQQDNAWAHNRPTLVDNEMDQKTV
jgi:hypothetical protein